MGLRVRFCCLLPRRVEWLHLTSEFVETFAHSWEKQTKEVTTTTVRPGSSLEVAVDNAETPQNEVTTPSKTANSKKRAMSTGSSSTKPEKKNKGDDIVKNEKDDEAYSKSTNKHRPLGEATLQKG